MPPSRYIFYGAEVMGSPLPSPSRNISGFLGDSTSEESDSDSVGEIDDNEASCEQLNDVIDDLTRQRCERSGACVQDACNSQTTANVAELGKSDLGTRLELGINRSESESNSDDGFGEGNVKKALEPITNSEATRQALSLILGGLSSYTCESEENSRLSGCDDPVTCDPGCLSSAAESLLADRPFSAVTMDAMLTKRDCLEPGNPNGTDDAKKDDNDVTDAAGAVIGSGYLQS